MDNSGRRIYLKTNVVLSTQNLRKDFFGRIFEVMLQKILKNYYSFLENEM